VRILATAVLTAGFEALFFTALTLASVGLTTLIGIGSAPVFVAVYDWIVRKERPATRTFVALALALGGLALLVSGSLTLGGNALLGAVLALATGASFAGISVVNRVPVDGLEPVPLTALAFTIGGVLLLPIAAIPGLGVATDAIGWALTLGLGIVITACAYAAYLTGLRTVPPFVATIVALLEPVIAAVLGAIVLGERLGPLGIVGGAVLGAAVVLLRPQRDESVPIH
jgi:DME family drug/metabolite transporter